MPMNKKLYPANWKDISNAIRFTRAGGYCEWCKKGPHLAMIRTAPGGNWLDEPAGTWRNCKGQPIEAPAKKGQKTIKVILTTAHLGTALPDGSPGDKRNKSDCRPENLAALCQYCHLIFDADEHQARARNYRGGGAGLKGLKQLAGITQHAAVEFAPAPEPARAGSLAPALPAPPRPPAELVNVSLIRWVEDYTAWYRKYTAWAGTGSAGAEKVEA